MPEQQLLTLDDLVSPVEGLKGKLDELTNFRAYYAMLAELLGERVAEFDRYIESVGFDEQDLAEARRDAETTLAVERARIIALAGENR